MIERSDVISFFDRCAPDWDAEMIRNEPVIRTILDNAGIRAGMDVLDVACGTGVLFPDYLARDVHSVTGVDIAPEMARRAAEKFPDARVTVLCGDIETVPLPQPFDCCMVYNAFPHFPDPARLIAHLATLLKTGGRLSVAHGMSRAMLDRHHAGSASAVSISLISEMETLLAEPAWCRSSMARLIPCAMDRRPPGLSSVARCAIRRAGSGKCGKAL